MPKEISQNSILNSNSKYKTSNKKKITKWVLKMKAYHLPLEPHLCLRLWNQKWLCAQIQMNANEVDICI